MGWGQDVTEVNVSLKEYLDASPKESEQHVLYSSPAESVLDARAKMINQKISNLIVTETEEPNGKLIAYLALSDIEALRS